MIVTTNKPNMCKHLSHIINQGYWWCDLKDETGKQRHPHCDCENCLDRDETYVVSQTYSAGETK